MASDYRHDEKAWNLRMTNLNAAVALAQLERLDEMTATKQAIAARYDAAFGGCPDASPMPRAPWAKSNCWLYSLLMDNEERAQALVTTLATVRIQARVFWRSLSDQKPYAQEARCLSGVARKLSGRVVALPSSSILGRDQQQRVIDTTVAFLMAGG
jgi:perosamine synthetase